MASESMIKVIYGRPMLPDLARVLACLYEKKVTFELEDLNKGVRMSQDILNLQISSHRHTPMLLDGPDELFGSRKICRHIVEKYGAYGYQYLLGKDPLARVSVEQWLQSEEHRFDPPSSALVFYLAFKVEADIEKVTQSEKKLEKVLNLYEQRLGESEFLAGSYFTLADLYHLPNTYYLESSVEYGYLFKDRKNVSRWWKHISERDSWKQVVKKFEEEGLQFNVSVSNGKTDQSSSSRHKNGVRNGPIGGTELSSKKKEAKEDIREDDEGEINASGNKKERTPSKEKKDDEAVQRKVEEGKKAKTPSADNKEHGAKKNDEIKEHDASTPVMKDKKETPKSDNKEMSGKTDEIKERDAHKPATEDKKETPKQADQDKSSSGDESKSVRTEETKDRDANKPTTEGEKEKPKPDGKDKSSTAEKEKPGQTDETNTRDANKPDTEGEKDAHNHHDNLHNKESEVNKPAREDKKTPQRDENKKDVEGEEDKVKDISDKAGQGKIHENKEHTANDSDTEGKRDGFKSDGKDKDSSGREKERDVNKENVNRGVSDSDNQVKKDSSPNDGKDKTSAGENKDTTPRNEKDKTN